MAKGRARASIGSARPPRAFGGEGGQVQDAADHGEGQGADVDRVREAAAVLEAERGAQVEGGASGADEIGAVARRRRGGKGGGSTGTAVREEGDPGAVGGEGL